MKEPEKYKQPEEETTRLSEPTVAYNSMAYLELEAEKAELIRTIANIDSKEIIDKVKQKLHDVLGLKEKTVVKKTLPCQLTEDEIKEEIEQAIDEIQQGVAKKCTLLLNTIYYDEDSMDNSSTKKSY